MSEDFDYKVLGRSPAGAIYWGRKKARKIGLDAGEGISRC
jgi:hypothetical protein